MSLQALLPLLGRSEQMRELLAGLRRPEAQAAAMAPDPATAPTVAAIWREFGAPVVVLTPHPESARRLADHLVTWCGEDAPIFHFTETESLPFERLTPDAASAHQRLRALAALEDRAAPRPPLIVASVMAAAQMTLTREAFRSSSHVIRAGDAVSQEGLLRRWTDMGYVLEPTVEMPGTASRRGGILDIYPVGAAGPLRLEFFGDEVDSIRQFDPQTQRSTGRADFVAITPAQETLPALADPETVQSLIGGLDFRNSAEGAADRITEELGRAMKGEAAEELAFYAGIFNHGSLFDYIPSSSLLISLRPGEIEESALGGDRRIQDLRDTKERRGDVPRRFPQAHLDWGHIAQGIKAQQRKLSISPWGIDSDLGGGAERLPFDPAPGAGGVLDRVWDVMRSALQTAERLVIVSQHAHRLRELAAEQGIQADLRMRILEAPQPGSITLLQGHLRAGLTLRSAGDHTLTILTDTEVFGVTKERRRVRKRPVRRGTKLSQLQPGVFVVHVEHGIGRFSGVTSLEGDESREYLVLEYADDDRLYVPTEHLDRLELYQGASDNPPRLTRLGTQEWARAKARARRATEQMAGELIALYAARAVAPGLATEPDTPWQDELEASFPYEETPDQAATLEAVKTDLEVPRPMDRLVCGDVGYGKTEIALRAAFKVVQSGRQVAILVPTTVLAQQHYDTFSERLKAFPVSVEVLSRFRTDAEQRSVVRGMAAGEVDICIGTHRMLQQDVTFKNLGLVVIDEEHRFGVAHKERLKRMRSQVDVMTLSATPIPRTLHMSLAGVRDMSTIETPPEERLPIKTYVSEESDELIREAILREMDRGGQVYLLHNRVKTIEYFAHKVEQLVPEASIRVGHGQMSEDELESVMSDFAAKEFDVLICTTIIESGIDLPNANTLIVDRADTFGLSQLYQLRGRIGRGANRAYAYFMVPRGKQLTETAEQRLNTILAATELGAGFQIALRDLEIRGMGNILGAEQSGQIAAVGFDMYTKLLSDAVASLKAQAEGRPAPEEAPSFSMVRVDIGLDTRIPEAYIEDLAERLGIYQRLARLTRLSQVKDLREELRDRFGAPPAAVDRLLYTVRVRILADACGVDSVTATENRVTLSLQEPVGGARSRLQKLLGRGVTVGHMQIRIDIDRENDEWMEELAWTLDQLTRFREQMMSMFAGVEAVAGG